MPRALWLLLGLRCRAWFRRLGRNAASVRGALTLGFGLLFFLLVLGPNVVLRLSAGTEGVSSSIGDPARRFGPLMLLGYCITTLLFSTGEQAITFSPAEVHFLFPAPFHRRQILAYKLIGAGLMCVAYALFVTGFIVPHTPSPFLAFPGLVLTLWFITLFSTAVALLIQVIGVRAVTVPRRILLVVLGLLVAAAIATAGTDLMMGGPAQALERLEQTTVARGVLTPMRWFVDTILARRLWPDFVEGAVRCLAIDGALVVLIFTLDAQYLEGAAAASERVYARLQRARSGGAFAAGALRPGRPRFGLPSFPFLRGAGPVAWRQLLSALRSARPLVIFIVLFSLMALGPLFLLPRQGEVEGHPIAGLAVGMLVMSIVSLTPMLTFDFRGDVDRMDVLKALPIAPSALAVGQLLTPTLLLSSLQIGFIVLLQLLYGGLGSLVAGVALFAGPFNFLSIGIENLLFLWFPARMVPGAPGDFQQMGRQALMMFLKSALLALMVLPAALVGAAVYLAFSTSGQDGTLPAVASAWLMLTVLSAGPVPLLVLAFRSFDVSRDTPP